MIIGMTSAAAPPAAVFIKSRRATGLRAHKRHSFMVVDGGNPEGQPKPGHHWFPCRGHAVTLPLPPAFCKAVFTPAVHPEVVGGFRAEANFGGDLFPLSSML
jgi:hypothetical protein